MAVTTKPTQRLRRCRRVRAKITGTAERPRLSVFRSNLGDALAGRREKMILQGHVGSLWVDGQYSRSRE